MADFAQQERELLRDCGLTELELRAANAGVSEQAIALALEGSYEEAHAELIELLLAEADDDLRIELPGGDLVKTLETAYKEQLECTVLVEKHWQTGRERIVACTAKRLPGAQGGAQPGASPTAPHSPTRSPPRDHSPIRSPEDSDDSGFLSPQQQEQQEQQFEDIEAEFHHVKSPEAKKAVCLCLCLRLCLCFRLHLCLTLPPPSPPLCRSWSGWWKALWASPPPAESAIFDSCRSAGSLGSSGCGADRRFLPAKSCTESRYGHSN